MAEAALELLLNDLRTRGPNVSRRFTERVLDHSLIVRESSGPPVPAVAAELAHRHGKMTGSQRPR
jgi:LacI family transcriptional regulator